MGPTRQMWPSQEFDLVCKMVLKFVMGIYLGLCGALLHILYIMHDFIAIFVTVI